MVYSLKTIFETSSSSNFLSGYYMDNVFSSCSKYLVITEISNCFKFPSVKQPAKLWRVNLEKGHKEKIGETNACNFQQGCRAQFIYFDNQEYIIYNDWSTSRGYFSKAINTSSKEILFFDHPIDSIKKDFSIVASINYEKLDKYKRSYSYGYYKKTIKSKKIVNDYDLLFFDPIRKRNLFKIKTEELKTFSSDCLYQLIDHSLFNPSGSKVAFYHTIKDKKGITNYLYIYDLKKNKSFLINKIYRGTHYNWISDNELIIWGSKGTIFTKIRRLIPKKLSKFLGKLYKIIIKSNSQTGNNSFSALVTGDRYLKYDLKKNKVSYFINYPEINIADGHPTFLNKSKILVTDTYPNSSRNLFLKIFIEKDSNFIIKKFKHNEKAIRTPFRADLHPKVCNNSFLIAIDKFESYRRIVEVFKLVKNK